MATISFLGTGSGIPSEERFFSSTLLHLEGTHLLVDAGEPCVHLLRERGDLLRELDAVLITHGHVDHIGGLPALLQGCMLQERTKPLSIYLPEEMIAPLRAWIRALYLTEEGFGFPVNWNAWKDNTPEIIDEKISIIPHASDHLKQCYRGLSGADPSRPCASFSLEIRRDSFCAIFSGDLSSPQELLTWISKPLTVLVCELSHFSLEQLGAALQALLEKTSVETLCLVHLSEEYAREKSEVKIQMEELLPSISNVFLPDDGEILDF